MNVTVNVVSDTGGNDPVCFLEETCDGEGASATDFSDCCSKPGAESYKNLDTGICQPCSGMTRDVVYQDTR